MSWNPHTPPAHRQDFPKERIGNSGEGMSAPSHIGVQHQPAANQIANPEEPLLSKSSPPPLLSVRTALILLLGVLCGTAVTALTTFAQHNLITAGLTGLTAASGAIAFFHQIIGPETPLR
jgi:hypothetical protein